MIHYRSLRFAVATGLLFPLLTLAAGIFPDVPDSHPFKSEIESLARASIINGNPDGKYYPERSVNRAEFLKLLYTATGREPQILSGCFTDVAQGSWYEAYVCDASSKANGFVQGYSDGKFRPASPVSRTEALKMTFMVFGLSAPEVSSSDQDLIKFVDISVSAWYSRYIIAAYKIGLLPIAGQSGSRFYPDRELNRGEAAAYIFNAQNLRTVSSSSSSTSSIQSSTSSESNDLIKNVTFPFSDADKVTTTKPISYDFTLTNAKTVVSVKTDIVGFYTADITCRLYLMNSDGFSTEYYLGVQTPGKCVMNVSVGPGKYHLQLQPSAPNISYTVDVKVGSSDGNDGFIDALRVQTTAPRTGVLQPNDLYDWYIFSVDHSMTATVDVTGTSKVNCIIYTPPEVDQFGFTGPECGKPYQFVSGNVYVIGIGRATDNLLNTVTYTIKWQ